MALSTGFSTTPCSHDNGVNLYAYFVTLQMMPMHIRDVNVMDPNNYSMGPEDFQEEPELSLSSSRSLARFSPKVEHFRPT